ncbi:MAG TPA: hypothetical protein ENJ18_05415 [Nannocystis exedens]|nr:hypothetical protein [Nannocystis exedens]
MLSSIRNLLIMSLYALSGACFLYLALAFVGSVSYPGILASAALLGAFSIAESVIGAIILLALKLRSAAHGFAKNRFTRGAMIPATLLGLAVLYPLYWMGTELASGPWIASQPWAPAVRMGPSALGSLGIFVTAYIYLTWPASTDTNRLRRRILTGLAIAGTLIAALADALVMPGLYPAFHLAALAIAAIFALIAMQRLLVGNTKIQPLGGPALLVLIITSAHWLTMSQTIRATLMLHSPSAATLIRSTAPSPPKSYLHEALAGYYESEFNIEEPPQKRGLLTIGDDWNIILITVDTLRSDTLPPVRTGTRDFARNGDTPFLDSWIDRSFRFTRAYSHATMTHRSMPATFRSLEAYEDPRRIGLPLSTYMAKHGRTPIAIANNYFLEPRFPAAQALLDGFESISIYEKADMRDQVNMTRELLQSAMNRPFFAWIHFYCMHLPGYNDKMLDKTGEPWPVRYNASLRWLDGEMKQLIDDIRDLGLSENTVIFFTSDHGEGLGDHNSSNHGPTIFDSEVRIPIVIYIPGQEGAEIDATIGNIDIVPTMTDLIGLPVDINHRGHSLVPLMLDPQNTPWTRDYYIENNNGSVVALVHDGFKLIYDVEGDIFYRFDLEADPAEAHNLYTGESDADHDMVRRLLHRSPQLFRDELENPETLGLLRALLDAADVDTPMPFLLRVFALAPQEVGLDYAFRIFDNTDNDTVRLALLQLLYRAAPKAWGKRLSDYIKSIAGTPQEFKFVERLALQSQAPFDRRLAADRVAHWSKKGSPDDWVPWLRLVKPWPFRSIKGYGDSLVRMMSRAALDDRATPATIELVLTTVATLGRGRALPKPEDRTSKGERDLARAALPFLKHSAPIVRRAACEALATVDDGSSLDSIRAFLEQQQVEPRLKQCALGTLVKLAGEAAIPTIIRLSKDPLLTVDCIDHLRRLGSPKGLSFLDRIRKTHYNGLIRDRAKRAAKAIRDDQKAKQEAAADSPEGDANADEVPPVRPKRVGRHPDATAKAQAQAESQEAPSSPR